jgi:2-C-methyl-D-erythritol 4-phosphate cytidylyltransferase
VTGDTREDTGAVIVAAGRSERMGGANKLWAPLTDATGHTRPLLALSIAAFESCPAIDRIVLVVAPDVIESAEDLVREEAFSKVEAVVAGGARRQDSVRAGLEALEACTWVAVHDGARPLVTPALIERGLDAARETGASCCAIRVADTVKEEHGGYAARTLDRSHLWLAQTPQVFRYDLLLDAHRRCEPDATDDASMLEALGVKVRLFEGSPRNVKVTTQEDLALVQALLEQP